MTTTLRPAGPEEQGSHGIRVRPYTVCVNSRPVGGLELSTDQCYGLEVGRIDGLDIDEPERRRGRGTVAALAAEEVLRQWGCTRIETSVPAAGPALRMAATLGYTERNRTMTKSLEDPGHEGPHPLPPGSVVRPMTDAEYGPWSERERRSFADGLIEHGVPRHEAEGYAAASFAAALFDGLATEGVVLLVLEHDGEAVGRLWLWLADPAWVFSVEVEDAHRGRGHGRTLMRVAEDAVRAADGFALCLNVFSDNAPALGLYAALGYRTSTHHLAKPLG